jgi:hypothetical protein
MAVSTLVQQDTALDSVLSLWPSTDARPVFSRNEVTDKWEVNNRGTISELGSTMLPGLLLFLKDQQNGLTPQISGFSNHTVAVASTGALTLSGEQTIDGVLTSASRVLVKNQADAGDNGIYVTDASTWTRATDYNQAAEIQTSIVNVSNGIVNGNTQFVQPLGAVTVGTTDLTFSPIKAPWSAAIVSLTASLA